MLPDSSLAEYICDLEKVLKKKGVPKEKSMEWTVAMELKRLKDKSKKLNPEEAGASQYLCDIVGADAASVEVNKDLCTVFARLTFDVPISFLPLDSRFSASLANHIKSRVGGKFYTHLKGLIDAIKLEKL